MSARREAFLAPYNQLYDLLHQAEGLRYSLQDLLHRYEGMYAGQQVAMQEFKATASSSNTLLGNLQQSAESLKEMVRYEVGKSLAANGGGSGEGNKQEVDELKERIKKLEEQLEKEK
jgi:ubiquinone biosynthesis protein UbiJ